MTAHYVYRCFAADGRLLYVGQTKDWTQRLETHYRGAFWAGDIHRVKVKAHRSKDVALAAEKRAIRTEHPRFNYQGRWAVRSIWSQDAWVDYVRAASANLSGSSQTRNHIETVFAGYAAAFGETHPLADSLRVEWAARDARMEADSIRRDAAWERQKERLDREDRRTMLLHMGDCSVCAAAGRFAIDCPDLLADLADGVSA